MKSATPLFLILIFISTIFAFEMPAIFTDHMVLQRDAHINVWGKAAAGTEVVVQLGDAAAETITAADGNWLAKLPPMPAGGPFELIVTAKDSVHTFHDVLIGEVWLASGQSNMEMQVNSVYDAQEEIAAADYPQIRLFTVGRELSGVPEWNVKSASWQLCSPKTVGRFSAVAYFFGRELHDNLHVPIGLINSSWGGTLAEAWTSADALHALPDFRARAEKVLNDKPDYKTGYARQLQIDRDFWLMVTDVNAGVEKGVHQPQFDDFDWQPVQIPGSYHSGLKPWYEGFVWFRARFEIPKKYTAKELVLHLGQINERDVTYVNGEQVGSTFNRNDFRKYTIPAGLLHTGENVLAVRVIDMWGDGGFPSVADSLYIADAASGKKICSLAGEWKLQIDIEPKLPQRTRMQDECTSLFNGMIAPLIPYTIQGVIWYQGESNAGRAFQYRSLFPTMIEDWRVRWGQGYFPFFFVQLANYQAQPKEPGESDWAELREAQTMTLNWPNTGQAVIIDIGDAFDIHPKNKQDVGTRLALAARHVAYGQNIVYSGPMYSHAEFEAEKVVLHFDHCADGLTTPNNETLHGFAIAGADKKFVWAEAKIVGNTVVVSHPDIQNPASVRYAWANNPDCNLYNSAGLPACPFRTDDWPGVTENRK